MLRLSCCLVFLGLLACGSASDRSELDTAGARAGDDAPWVTLHGLEWKRQGPAVAVRFHTDGAVRSRVCDDNYRCVPAGEGIHHGVIVATGSSTLTIEIESPDGALAAFGPYAVSEG